MSNLNNISEQQLDLLLNEVYLEVNAINVNEQEADFVFNKNYDVSINPNKEKECLSKLYAHATTQKTNWWTYILILTLVLTISILLYVYFQHQEVSVNNTNNIKQTINSTNNQNSQTKNQSLLEDEHSVLTKTRDTFPKTKHLILLPIADSLIFNGVPESKAIKQNIEQSVPYLTPKDKINYATIKQQLLRNLSLMHKNFYTKIPASKLSYAGKPTIIDAFAMRNMCVSNLEYKVFLADLISQNRTEDYFKAQVFSETWSKYQCHQIAEHYFQDEAYNDFPVVNITQDGAMLFCKWLQEEFELYTIQNHLKNAGIKIRLPYSEEWISTARDGYAKIVYENGYHTLYDGSESLVDKAFANRQEKIRRKNKVTDSLYQYMLTNHYGSEEASIKRSLNKALSYYPYLEKDTLNPSKMKVMNKLFKVSEIVVQKNPSKHWLSGQTWKNKNEYVKFEQEFKTYTCSPFVGFRFVVINPTDPEYKNPFW